MGEESSARKARQRWLHYVCVRTALAQTFDVYALDSALSELASLRLLRKILVKLGVEGDLFSPQIPWDHSVIYGVT